MHGIQKLLKDEYSIKSVLQNTHKSGTRSGVLFNPSTIGEPIAADMAQTNKIVKQTLRLFLCLAYLMGCVTAIYLLDRQKEHGYMDVFIQLLAKERNMMNPKFTKHNRWQQMLYRLRDVIVLLFRAAVQHMGLFLRWAISFGISVTIRGKKTSYQGHNGKSRHFHQQKRKMRGKKWNITMSNTC